MPSGQMRDLGYVPGASKRRTSQRRTAERLSRPPEFVHDVMDVVFDCLLRDVQLAGNRFVDETVTQQRHQLGKHFPLGRPTDGLRVSPDAELIESPTSNLFSKYADKYCTGCVTHASGSTIQYLRFSGRGKERAYEQH